MHAMVLTFRKDKETKNTVRFAEVIEVKDGLPIVGSLYVKKSVAGTAEQLRVTIEETR